MFVLLLIWSAIFLFIYLLDKSFSYLHVAFAYLFFHSISVFLYGIETGRGVAGGYSVAVASIFFVCGLYAGCNFFNRIRLRRSLYPYDKNSRTYSRFALVLIALFSMPMVYHLMIIGVPVLSGDILTARFDSKGSGLFGLPSRFYLFGCFFIYFVIAALWRLGFVGDRMWLFANLYLIVILVSKGSKGSLLHYVVAYAIVVYPFKLNSLRLIGQWGVILALVLLSFFATASLHMQAGGRYSDFAMLFADRFLYLSGKAYYVIYYEYTDSFGFGGGRYALSDVATFISRFQESADEQFFAMQSVSAMVTGSTLGKHYIVPQELNIFGYLFLEAGWSGILVGGVVAGFFCGSLKSIASRKGSVLTTILAYYGQLLLFFLIIKGDVVYYVLNMFISLVIFFIVLWMVWVLFFGRTRV